MASILFDSILYIVVNLSTLYANLVWNFDRSKDVYILTVYRLTDIMADSRYRKPAAHNPMSKSNQKSGGGKDRKFERLVSLGHSTVL